MIATRDALKALIIATYPNFKTTWTVAPKLVSASDILDDGTKKGGMAIYLGDGARNWKSTGFDEDTFAITVDIFIEATEEMRKDDRGVANEAWLIGVTEGILDIIFNNENLASSTIVHAPVEFKGGDVEGVIRFRRITAYYNKRRAR